MTFAIDTSAMSTANWQFSASTHRVDYKALKLQGEIDVPPPASLGPADTTSTPQAGMPLDLQLFDNAALLKKDMSELAMHLSKQWIGIIRSEIDTLLALKDWDEESSSLIARSSFATFLRFITHAQPKQIPGLGVSTQGHLLAAWHHDRKRITVDFMPDGFAKAGLTMPSKRDVPDAPDQEALGWYGRVANLENFIRRNDALDCLQ